MLPRQLADTEGIPDEMRKYFILVSVTLVVACVYLVASGVAGKSPRSQDSDRTAITEALMAQQAAWNRGDVDAFMAGYWRSRELTFSGSSGVSRGWDGVLARYKKNYPDRAAMGQLDFSALEIRFLGPDAALVLGQWHLKREKDEPGGVFSLVWQRFPEGWKIVHDHTSAVPEKH
jgi:ketosteroid isomerase-like protein